MRDRKSYPISKVDPEDTKIELTCRAVKAVLLYFEEKYGREKLEEFIYDTRMNIDYLADRNNWISFAYLCRLLTKLVEYTGDPKAPFIAGTYSTKKGCYGALERFFSILGTPEAAYRLITEFTPRYSKINQFAISNLKKNSCTIILRMLDNYKQDKNNCLNLQGILASFPTLWRLPLAKVKEARCAAEGGDSCVYQISWHNRPSHLFGLLGLLAGLVFVYVIGIFLWTAGNVFMLVAIPLLGYSLGRIKDYKIALKESLDFNEKEGKDLMESIETIEKLNIELQEKVEQRTEELHASNRELQDTLDKLKKSQEQLIQSEKMASVGRLAAGMAHELNNPVGAIRNYIQDVLEDTAGDDPRRERLKKAEKATGRCKRIVSDLLTFSRQSKELKVVNVNDIAEAAILNAEEEISGQGIRILRELEPDLPVVRVDSMQLRQVFMNIIMNAADAIKGEGQIVVKTSCAPENIFIEVSDTGEGIPEDVQDKIFDPFFTTKAPGKGKGLGLAISYNIIKRFKGDIRVKSEKGKGTTLIITLPLK